MHLESYTNLSHRKIEKQEKTKQNNKKRKTT